MENAKAEIVRMQQEKEHFEDSMKKAFMRGVCALNLEAMTIFQSRGDAGWCLQPLPSGWELGQQNSAGLTFSTVEVSCRNAVNVVTVQ